MNDYRLYLLLVGAIHSVGAYLPLDAKWTKAPRLRGRLVFSDYS